jgi:hypothetical protein
VKDPTGRVADYGVVELFSDPDPVPAVRELMETGSLRTVPHTHLVDAPESYVVGT